MDAADRADHLLVRAPFRRRQVAFVIGCHLITSDIVPIGVPRARAAVASFGNDRGRITDDRLDGDRGIGSGRPLSAPLRA